MLGVECLEDFLFVFLLVCFWDLYGFFYFLMGT